LGGRLRQRVNGALESVYDFPPELFGAVVARIKVLASMDVADKRQPQDGHYLIERNRKAVDARVCSLPTVDGEKLVIRLLKVRDEVPSLQALGMPDAILSRYREVIHAQYGFVVLCGPTGSGKTTTAYSSLAERNAVGTHICSIEDPVEIRLAGTTQVQVNVRAGVTFASALRSFLRADPNIIMIGEMRDAETACAATAAALSGALILTTLHAGSAAQAVERLCELGARRAAIASSVTGILGQRLVPVPGGRTGAFEFIRITDELRSAIAAGASPVRIAQLAGV